MTIRYFPETIGLCDIIDDDKDKRLCFFEIDSEDPLLIQRIKDTYEKYKMDHVLHRTKNGYHFLGSTIVNKETWKLFHSELKDINPKCPMVCMRIKGNKYPNEDLFFYRSFTSNVTDGKNNCQDLCNLLNKIFGSSLLGTAKGSIKLVRYKPHIEI